MCGDTNNLTDPNFEYGSSNFAYAFEQFTLDTSSGALTVVFQVTLATDTDRLVLVVGDSSFRFDGDDNSAPRSRQWHATGLSWTAGTDVSVSVIVPEHLAACDGDTAPAGAFWTSCLTVGEITSGSLYGYDEGDGGSLDDTTFSRDGTDHEIDEISSTSTVLKLQFKAAQASSASGWTLQVGSDSFDLGEATYLSSAFSYSWSIAAALFGSSEVDDEVTVSLRPNQPGAPTGLGATAVSESQIDLSWTAPAYTGTSAITGYKIEVSSDGNSWSDLEANTGSTATTYSHTGLSQNTTRHYRVSAINAQGTGPASDVVQDTTQADLTPPTLSSATVHTGGLRLELEFGERLDYTVANWPELSAFGVKVDGQPVALNTHGSGVGGFQWLVSVATSIKSGQTVLVSYTDPTAGNDAKALQDRSGNDVATFIDQSVANNSTVAPVAPDAPSGLTASAVGSTQIDLSWTAPAYNGGRAITGYRIEISDDGTSWTDHLGTTGNTDTAYSHTGLSGGTTRHYRVSAINAAGTGSASNVANATTSVANTAPGAPTGLAATGGQGRIDLSWTAPSNDGGTAVTGYRIEVSPDGQSWNDRVADTSSTATSYAHTGLAPGTTRHYRVSAINAVGTGSASSSDSATTFSAPGAPTGLTATAAGQAGVVLAWTAPSSDGGSPITGYRIDYSSDGASYTSLVANSRNTSTGYSDTRGLSSGTHYYRIYAINAVGMGPASNTASVRIDPVTPPGPTTPRAPSAPIVVRDDRPLKLALWTDNTGYLAGETVRLYRTTEPRGDRGDYQMLFYLERAGGGQRRYFAPGVGSMELREDAVDHRGQPEGSHRARSVPEADRELTWEGDAPEPGLWQFVVELRPEGADVDPKRAWAKFVVAERSQLLIRRGFVRDVSEDMTLRANTIYYMGSQLYVREGATLRIEPGTLVRAFGPEATIIVEPGGRIEAAGTREAPVVLTCSSPTGTRKSGCWGGLRLLGRAPVTRIQGEAAGVPAGRDAYGGTDPEHSSGSLGHVRIEFAGAGGEPGTAAPALALYGAGSETILDHVQVHASLAEGILFSGGTAGCSHCVASGSGTAGLAWERGWQGTASHLYVQHGPEGGDGLVGANDSQGHDLVPRSRPILSNVTLVHPSPYGREAQQKAGLRLRTGTAVSARDLLVTRFGGGAIDAGGREALLFGEGESSVTRAILYRNGFRPGAGQLRGGIAAGVEFEDRDPRLRNTFWEANPDPRPVTGSPALSTTNPTDQAAEGEAATGAAYIGAFGKDENWLEEWTFFGPESDFDTRGTDDGEGQP